MSSLSTTRQIVGPGSWVDVAFAAAIVRVRAGVDGPVRLGAPARHVIRFWEIDRLAGALLLPYLLWVSFAAALDFSVWRVNPQSLG